MNRCACGRPASRRIRGADGFEFICDECAWLDFGARPGSQCYWASYDTLHELLNGNVTTAQFEERMGLGKTTALQRLVNLRKRGRIRGRRIPHPDGNRLGISETTLWSY